MPENPAKHRLGLQGRFFARGKIAPTYTMRPLDDINDIFHEMEEGHIDGRIVMKME